MGSTSQRFSEAVADVSMYRLTGPLLPELRGTPKRTSVWLHEGVGAVSEPEVRQFAAVQEGADLVEGAESVRCEVSRSSCYDLFAPDFGLIPHWKPARFSGSSPGWRGLPTRGRHAGPAEPSTPSSKAQRRTPVEVWSTPPTPCLPRA